MKVITYSILLILFSVNSICAESISVSNEGVIAAKSFFDQTYFMVGRKAVNDAIPTKVTYSGNKLGEEYQPQEGQNKVGETESYYWDIQSTSSCLAASDGIYKKQRAVVCKKYSIIQDTAITVVDSSCDLSSKPSEFINCINPNLIYQWLIKNNGKCSVDCGVGVVNRDISCLRINIETNYREIVDNNECEIYGLTKPDSTATCSATASCTKGWSYSSYGSCSGSCGEVGQMTRSATCHSNDGSTIDNSECQSLVGDPVTTMPCTPDCSGWAYSEWGECEATCFNSGTQSREAVCKNSQNEIVDDLKCPGSRDILDLSRSCIKACPAATCAELFSDYPDLPNGTYQLIGPKGTFSATCDMTGGGWTLVPSITGLSNFASINAIKGLNDEQVHRFVTLYKNNMSSWINYSHQWNSDQKSGANPSWYFDIPVGNIVSFSKTHGLRLPVQSNVNSWSFSDDKDTGRLILYLYDTSGNTIYTYNTGYINWPSSWNNWYKFYYSQPAMPDPVESNLKTIRYYFSCYRYAGTQCSAEIRAYTYINHDLPRTNLYIK